MSSAMFWLDKYHIDGLRVDAVASMLYLDYSRKQGEWIPNKFGGRENLDAIDFLRRFNQEAYKEHPEIQTTAEESTSWPMVSKPVYLGGLGFGMKWDMGWMHDTLKYFQNDPIHRKYHHNVLTFRMLYSFHENFVLPLSHDEVVHGKGSLIGKMPGDEWQKFANLRLLFAYMYAQPGKKLLFMGERVRPGARVGTRYESGMARGAVSGPSRRASMDGAVESLLSQRTRHARARQRARGIRVGGCERQRDQHDFAAAQERVAGRYDSRGLQLHSCAARSDIALEFLTADTGARC